LQEITDLEIFHLQLAKLAAHAQWIILLSMLGPLKMAQLPELGGHIPNFQPFISIK
jgi:hypothetical protein